MSWLCTCAAAVALPVTAAYVELLALVHINTQGILVCPPACCVCISQTLDLVMIQR